MSTRGTCLVLLVTASLSVPRIQNPLHGIPKDRLLAQVQDFAREQGFEAELKLLEKAALLAQSPKDFESIEELDEDDKAIIRREITRTSCVPATCVC